MKNIIDLENMKIQKNIPFGSVYEYLMCTLEDYYVAKVNGKDRIKEELSKWDVEAQRVIIEDLIVRIGSSFQDVNFDDLHELL